VEGKAERLALEIERAVHDTHPTQKEYGQQARTVSFNLKSNPELCNKLLKRTLAPTGIAVMTSDELASKELQRETAEMKARAEKQAILITDQDGPRLRRTHKGEEVVEADTFIPSEDTPSVIRRPSMREPAPEASKPEPAEQAEGVLHIDTHPSPKQPDFDINKVFSSVRSPTTTHHRRPSAPINVPNGPGDDPDVDRLLQDDNESPPYSPTEETDPEVVWRGSIAMNTVADFPATAKYVGGCDIKKTLGLAWTDLVPRKLVVAGRIDTQKAIEYLCGLRYSEHTDIIVLSVSPASEDKKSDFYQLIDYFVSKGRYGVLGERAVGNIRDTYLVPVPPGEGNQPEFILNLQDNYIPEKRADPMLLLVFVYRNDPRPQSNEGTPMAATPTGISHGPRMSISGPAFSPTSPQGPFQSQSLPPRIAGPPPLQPQTPSQPPPAYPGPPQPTDARQQAGRSLAGEVLGPLINCPTVQFILPQAFQMSKREWEIIRDIFTKDAKAREDLQHLSALLEKHGQV
jgi:hypothetical protein